jgi:LacI family transcriptional regulator
VTATVGLLVPLVNDPYFGPMVAGAAEEAHDHELRLALSPTLHQHAREAAILRQLMNGAADGAVLILPELSSAELERALTSDYPFVVVDPLMPLDERIPTVTAAHRSGAEQAMRHLLELGHRRIATITGPPGWLATEERRRGCHAALAAAGLALDPQLVVASDFELAPGAQAAAMLLGRPDPPTAIFAFNDAIAIGTLRAANERGLRVPEDVSVVGFDDIGHATIVTPQLTTVRQPLPEMGHTAVSLLLRLVDRERIDTPHIELATRLVVRGTTAPPRHSTRLR